MSKDFLDHGKIGDQMNEYLSCFRIFDFMCMFGEWRRYFVLADGVIRYFARDKDAISPDNQKGEMSLVNASVVAIAASPTQLQIIAGNADGYSSHPHT